MRLLFATVILTLFSFSSFAETTSFDHVQKTGEIRCGYGISDPWVYMDFKTNKPAGLMVTIAEALGKVLNKELIWGEETGWANMPQALYNGRVDVACSTLWNDPARGNFVAYTDPVFYNPIYAYTRATETRFDTREDINQTTVTIAAQDGGFSADIAMREFSNAKIKSIPQFAAWQDLFLNVATGKADILFADEMSIENFNKNNEKKLKRVALDKPVSVYGTSFAVSIKDHAMFQYIQTGVRQLHQSGQIDVLTKEFREKYPDSMLMVKSPY